MSDYISRTQAIDALRAMQTYKMFAEDDLLLIDQAGAQTELMMLPSAQPVSSSCSHENDVISRQEVIDAIEKNACNTQRIMDAVNNLPYVQPERKTGRWTIKNGELAIWDVCSECKKMVMHRAPFYNYCPNCGADMRGEEDESYGIPEEVWNKAD